MAATMRIKSVNELKGLNERAFQQQLLQLAKLFGWQWYHTFFSKWSEPGFPDLVLVRPRSAIIFAELKSDAGRLTDAQRKWLELLQSATHHEAVVWRPKDWELVVERLR